MKGEGMSKQDKTSDSNDRATRLAKARAAKAEAEAARAALQAEREPDAEVERLEREASDAATLLTAERELGALGVGFAYVKTRLGVVVVKPPDTLLWRRFQDRNNPNEEQTREFLDTCIYSPDPEAWDRILNVQPATLGAVARLVARLAGFDEDKIVASGKG
jgi:hypothetical protein